MNTTDIQTETQILALNAPQVRKGDLVQFQTVETVKVGTKWVELRDAAGKLIRRIESTETVMVERQVETEASKKNRSRAMMNEMIARKVETFEPSSPAILEKMTAEVAAGRMISSFDYEKLFSAQANDKVMAEFAYVVERNLGEVTDYVDILDAFKNDLMKRLSHKTQYITNRSTSACSNLMDDHEVAAIASFLERGAYGF